MQSYFALCFLLTVGNSACPSPRMGSGSAIPANLSSIFWRSSFPKVIPRIPRPIWPTLSCPSPCPVPWCLAASSLRLLGTVGSEILLCFCFTGLACWFAVCASEVAGSLVGWVRWWPDLAEDKCRRPEARHRSSNSIDFRRPAREHLRSVEERWMRRQIWTTAWLVDKESVLKISLLMFFSTT